MRENSVSHEIFPTFMCSGNKRRILEEKKHMGKPTDREKSRRSHHWFEWRIEEVKKYYLTEVAAECEPALVTVRSQLDLCKVAVPWTCGQGHTEHREKPPYSLDWPLTWHDLAVMSMSYFDPSPEPPPLVFQAPSGKDRSEVLYLWFLAADHENRKEWHCEYLMTFANANCLSHSRWVGGLSC